MIFGTTVSVSQAISVLFFLLGIRTLLFWIQQWQVREYRWDRLRDHLFSTKEGRKKIWNLWFFKGFFPRPKLSFRVLLILTVSLLCTAGTYIGLQLFFHGAQNHSILNACIFNPVETWQQHLKCFFLGQSYESPLALVVTERLLWLMVAFSVVLTNPLIKIAHKRLFLKAYTFLQTIDSSCIRIALSGSFGKSSTKELLVHCLKDHYGEDQVLYNPENENNEVAIARLILKKKAFFLQEGPKVLLIETGAYKKGEVERVCDFIQPHYGIITGLNTQHLSLFGSLENIKQAETELAHACEKKVFINAENDLLQEALSSQEYKAKTIFVEKSFAQNINTDLQKTSFEWEKVLFTLPWPGSFFITNALLALSVAKELGIPVEKLKKSLQTLPPLERALHVEQHPQWFWMLKDPYSANPDGVLAAIEHLKLVPGKKVFVGIPLIELGKEAPKEHERIFQALSEIEADIFWLKDDFSDLGKDICGEKWKGKDLRLLKKTISELKPDDGILIESRIPRSIAPLLDLPS